MASGSHVSGYRGIATLQARDSETLISCPFLLKFLIHFMSLLSGQCKQKFSSEYVVSGTDVFVSEKYNVFIPRFKF
jgi:hypothetical protein